MSSEVLLKQDTLPYMKIYLKSVGSQTIQRIQIVSKPARKGGCAQHVKYLIRLSVLQQYYRHLQYMFKISTFCIS